MPRSAVSPRPLLACAAALTLLAAVGGGCSLTECAFDGEEVAPRGRTLEADLDVDSETLTILFVSSPVRPILVQPEVEESPAVHGAERLDIVYDTREWVFAGGSPSTLAAEAVGDTVYVFVEGDLAPSLFRQACSPPPVEVDVSVLGLTVPERVSRVSVDAVFVDELHASVRTRLRQRDAERQRWTPTTV